MAKAAVLVLRGSHHPALMFRVTNAAGDKGRGGLMKIPPAMTTEARGVHSCGVTGRLSDQFAQFQHSRPGLQSSLENTIRSPVPGNMTGGAISRRSVGQRPGSERGTGMNPGNRPGIDKTISPDRVTGEEKQERRGKADHAHGDPTTPDPQGGYRGAFGDRPATGTVGEGSLVASPFGAGTAPAPLGFTRFGLQHGPALGSGLAATPGIRARTTSPAFARMTTGPFLIGTRVIMGVELGCGVGAVHRAPPEKPYTNARCRAVKTSNP